MSSPASLKALSNLLRRIRRRHALARCGDAAFVAVAFAGIAAAVTLPFGIHVIVPISAGLIAFFTTWRPGASLPDTAAWLDQRHGLHDLLASAWATRADAGPWTTALHAVANATAADLPPPGRLARFSTRHHACLLAGCVAVVLIARLLSPSASPGHDDDTARPLAVAAGPSDRPTNRQIAAEITRAPDTADSPTRQPTPAPVAADPAASPSPRPRAPGEATNGPGRADSDRIGIVLPPSVSPDHSTPTAPGPAGSGRPTDSTEREGANGGRVDIDMSPGQKASALPTPPNDRPAAVETHATPVPTAYRDLVREYFAR